MQTTSQPSSTYNNSLTSSSNRTPIDQQFQKLSSDFLPPNQATLSRHSFLGPNGLKSQWVAPSRIKVENADLCYPLIFLRHFEAVTSQFFSDATEDPFQFVGMKQPTPPTGPGLMPNRVNITQFTMPFTKSMKIYTGGPNVQLQATDHPYIKRPAKRTTKLDE
ncbi:hypothetical protein YC2023_002298 [Brassica napus]